METYTNENLTLNMLKRLSLNLLFVVEVGIILAGGALLAYVLLMFGLLYAALS